MYHDTCNVYYMTSTGLVHAEGPFDNVEKAKAHCVWMLDNNKAYQVPPMIVIDTFSRERARYNIVK